MSFEWCTGVVIHFELCKGKQRQGFGEMKERKTKGGNLHGDETKEMQMNARHLVKERTTAGGSDSAVVREMRSRSNPRRNVPGVLVHFIEQGLVWSSELHPLPLHLYASRRSSPGQNLHGAHDSGPDLNRFSDGSGTFCQEAAKSLVVGKFGSTFRFRFSQKPEPEPEVRFSVQARRNFAEPVRTAEPDAEIKPVFNDSNEGN
ncbi:hypothetical protein C8F04DRAFT_1174727 [Mycena alexandri]|uniref:Uncharacterized protein n=1 Tax=Mycena alexandri TaxID=1745969 RepID=A0AAD6X9M5_9AGAR|nr:hypothetical protein C8F04DRAFT_1174727 [Mycena alexandri]